MQSCEQCDRLVRLRGQYESEAGRIEQRERERKKALRELPKDQRDDPPAIFSRDRGRPEVVKPNAFHLPVAAEWFASHRHLEGADAEVHPALELVDGVPKSLLEEARDCSEAQFRQRLRRFSIRLLAKLAGCSERSAYRAVKEIPEEEPADLVSVDEDHEWRDWEWIVGREPSPKELKAARRSRLDPGPKKPE